MSNSKVVLIGFMVAILSTFLFASVNSASSTSASPKIDRKTITAIMAKAKPLIEAISGRKFKQRLTFKLVKREVVHNALLAQMRPIYKKLLKGDDNDAVSQQAEEAAVTESQMALGIYSPLKKTLYIVPDNVAAVMAALGISPRDFDNYLFLIVAHEMVHALDDQYFDLEKKRLAMANTEALQAFSALVEGDAVFITNKIANRLKLSKTVKALSMKSAAGVVDESNRLQQQILRSTYIKGDEFVRAITQKGGMAAITAAFRSPPVSTRQIMNPELYLSPPATTDLNCSKLLERIAGQLPDAGMQQQSFCVGTMNLSAMLIADGFPEDAANSVANACLSGAAVVANKQSLEPEMMTVLILDFSGRKPLRALLKMDRKMEASEQARFNARHNASFTVVKDEALKIDGVDTARFWKIIKKTNTMVVTQLSARGGIGTLFVALDFVNMQKSVTEKAICGILKTLDRERRKMLSALPAGETDVF